MPDEEQVECLRAASPKLISPALICSSSWSARPRSFTRMCAAEAERLISTPSNAWTGCRLIVVALPVGVALLVAETLLIAIAARGGAAGDGRTAEGGACGGRRLLQPVEEAHRDAGTRRGGMSVAHGCREAKRVTGREEEKDGHGDLHCRRVLPAGRERLAFCASSRKFLTSDSDRVIARISIRCDS